MQAARPGRRSAPPPSSRRTPGAGSHREAGGPIRLGARQLVVLSVLCAASAVAIDTALADRLSLFYDLCFVLISLVVACLARRDAFFTAGVLPPLLMAGVVGVLALVDPATLTATHLAFVSTWLTGLAHHGAALVAGHLVVLTVLGLKVSQESRRPRGRRRAGP